jgi:hypothetical protein
MPMTDVRIRDYESSDAEDLNRVAVSAYGQFRDQFQDWPAMLAWLSKASALTAIGETIVAEVQNRFAGAVTYFGPNGQREAFFDQRWSIIRMLVVTRARLEHGMHRKGEARRITCHGAPHESDHDRRLANVSQDGFHQSL